MEKMKSIREKKIAVIYGGPGSEREVSLKTGRAVYDTLNEAGFKYLSLLDGSDLSEILKIRPDICFNAMHGRYGEDGALQGFLEILGIPYTGSGVSASSLAFDKHLSKLSFAANNIPTPAYEILKDGELPQKFPCVVKPAREGSTIGITIVKSPEGANEAVKLARRYDKKVMAEEFIEGKEFTVSIFNELVLPAIWIKPVSGFYDYESKYTPGKTLYLFDLNISDKDKLEVQRVALGAYKALGCKGAARTDIIFDNKTAYVLEVNTMPGMTGTSLLPKAAREAGISFAELLTMMLQDAVGI